jgi:hypothetical protein
VSYQLTVSGGFRLEPPVGQSGRDAVAAANRGWRISPNGRLLYLPEGDQHPNAFEGLRLLVAEVLPAIGSIAEGELKWTGEDGVEGTVRITAGAIEVAESEPQELSPGEVQRLLGGLATGAEAQQLEALEILEHFQVSSSQVVAAIAQALQAQSQQVCTRSANALATLGAASLPALPSLIAALDDPEPWVQGAAAEAIGAIGPAAASALPALTQLQKHPSYGPAGLATQAISKIRGAS